MESILRPHQKGHVERLLYLFKLYFILGDLSPTGSGKTITTMVISMLLKLHIIIVCPSTARLTWESHFKKYGLYGDEKGENATIITYESLRSTKGHQPKHGLLFRDENDGIGPSFTPSAFMKVRISRGVLFVFDEAQKVKNVNQNYNVTHAICEYVRKVGKQNGRSRVLLLSATLFDKMGSAINFLRLFGVMKSSSIYDEYAIGEIVNYAESLDLEKYKRFEEEYSECGQKEFVFNLFIHFFKDKFTSTMPKIVQNATFDFMNHFCLIDEESKEDFTEGVNRLITAIRDEEDETVMTKGDSDYGRITKAMIKIQKSMINLCKRKIEEKLNKGEKVIIFTDYYIIIDELLKAFSHTNPREITGRLKKKDRLISMDKFNEPNFDCSLLICNTAVGGNSITLDDQTGKFKRSTFILPNYLAINISQATGRTYRTNTVGHVEVSMLYPHDKNGVGPFIILDSLLRKGKVLSQIHSDDPNNIFFDKFRNVFEVPELEKVILGVEYK